MKANRQSAIPAGRCHLGRRQPEPLTVFEEQVASTGFEQPWIVVTVGLLVLILGLYWLNERPHFDQPVQSSPPVAAVTKPGQVDHDVATNGLAPTGAEAERFPQAVDHNSGSQLAENERLVRQFYEEALNQREFTVMNELLAEQVLYQEPRQSGKVWDRTALMQRLSTGSNSHNKPYYAIQQMTYFGDLVGVYWLASEQSFDIFEPSL